MSHLSFPVYRLPTKPSEDGGIIYYATENTETDKLSVRVIDDLNKPGKTLAERRIALLKDRVPLYTFGLSVYFVGDLIRLSKAGVHWIDSNGRLFEYKKSKSYKAVVKRITKLHNMGGYWIFEVEGDPARYKSMYGPPGASYNKAVFLQEGYNFIFYGFTDQDKINIKRRSV